VGDGDERPRCNALAQQGTPAERGSADSAAGAVLLAGLALVLVGAAVAGAVGAGWDPAASVQLGDVAIPLWAYALLSLGLALVLAVVALVRWRAR